MTTKTTPYIAITFIREDGHLGLLWAWTIQCVWGDGDRGEFAGYIATEYATGKIWEIDAWRIQKIEHKFMIVELA